MNKRFTSKITLSCASPEIKRVMISFFERYKNELPMFIKEQLTAMGMESDPALIFKKDIIEINRVNLDKGMVHIVKDDVLTSCFVSNLIQCIAIIVHAPCIMENGLCGKFRINDQGQVAGYYLFCAHSSSKWENLFDFMKIGLEHEIG